MDQQQEQQATAPAQSEELEPPHVMSSEKWKRIKAEMATPEK